MKVNLSVGIRLPTFLAHKLFCLQAPKKRSIVEIVEERDWVIKRIGVELKKRFAKHDYQCELDTLPLFHSNKLIHFGSINTFTEKKARMSDRSNILVATMYHGNFGINKQMDNNIKMIIRNHLRLDKIIVSTTEMKRRMISWGIPPEKLVIIPIGFEIEPFIKSRDLNMAEIRQKYQIPTDAICIGSFQKDGNDWGDGNEPKLIKGPDVFVKSVCELSKKFKVHCLLSGPARGYVKNELHKNNISFTHIMAKDFSEIVTLYRCLDLYLVTAREEGGPMSLMESMASGVPLVSTNVGMAPDMIIDGENAFIVPVDDVQGLVAKSVTVLTNVDVRSRLVNHGFKTVGRYDWDVLIEDYVRLYKELMEAKFKQ
ncbi:MAG: glycosyltransferase family 4 protein [Bdellovibrionota bacterium]